MVAGLLAWASLAVPGYGASRNAPEGSTIPPGPVIYLPLLVRQERTEPPPPRCPQSSSRSYTLIPVEGPPADHPDVLHGDLNLALRSYVAVEAYLGLVDINGDADPHAPKMPGLFLDGRFPQFTSAHRVYEWDWSCGEHGCRDNRLTSREVTLLGMATTPGEPISFPARGPEIYGGGFIVLVLYAEENRITLGYTRRDSVAPGYAVHLENLCVDPALLALYREANRQGRGWLPALRNGEVLGTALGTEVLVAIRDRGTFMDPRSRKDWW